MTFILYLCIVLFIAVCLFLVLLVLIQKGRGGGLASAFGGMGGNTAFGAKTGDVLTWATSIVFGVFIFLAVVLNMLSERQAGAAGMLPGGGPAPTNQPAPLPGSPEPAETPPIVPGQ